MNKKTFAQLLTYLGIIPFIIGILLIFTKLQASYLFLNTWELTYGAVIVSFIAGTHWALCLTNKVKATVFIHSNLIALLSWGSLLLQDTAGTLILIFCFLYLLVIEYQFKREEIINQWYFNMRCIVTSIVTSLLAIHVIIL